MVFGVDFVKTVNAVQATMALAITVALGVVTVRIQRQQTKIAREQAATNRLQYRLSLFERRMTIFDATTKLFGEITRDARVELDQLFTFLRQTRECELLFGHEIKEYLDEIYKKGVDLHARRVVRGPEDFETETQLLIWFTEQYSVATQKFLRYLDFREP
jgi:hypothetical protein